MARNIFAHPFSSAETQTNDFTLDPAFVPTLLLFAAVRNAQPGALGQKEAHDDDNKELQAHPCEGENTGSLRRVCHDTNQCISIQVFVQKVRNNTITFLPENARSEQARYSRISDLPFSLSTRASVPMFCRTRAVRHVGKCLAKGTK